MTVLRREHYFFLTNIELTSAAAILATVRREPCYNQSRRSLRFFSVIFSRRASLEIHHEQG